ncbi:5-dehydro-4-deoxy-D-glucuronate isomerase [Xanthocytophaga agilis]|uniref:4-deoxy-L-threo-5-hexosulose-uronate ketol-isomerase n=1 Tax=Xanthocytophaga agilis TaxID=3048010 RepID=A0AAE3R9N8_9BACT|nr:5-dehydro-4-deoxy-D-glucuronate isomerase [Xanthocytophaga agilis]MDJ1504055.1 5-dehydro-4-deoxy-D-glucuronate isomerase [Xanthocytophaga agilis]
MEIRHQNSPKEVATFNTQQLRDTFLIEKLFEADQISFVYSHYDRVIVGGSAPVNQTISLPNPEGLKANFFLERREIGIINVGGKGQIIVDGTSYDVNKMDCVYAGKGVKSIEFKSLEAGDPAKFFWLSSPAHQTYPTKLLTKEQANPTNMGAAETANQRTIYKYIHLDGIQSCQLVMGLTVLYSGSVWNTMPPHTHDRRMEVYCYFDIPENQRVLHLMGDPAETRHIWTANHQALISPPWSIHSGCGTASYSFIWGMAGENQVFTDMDGVQVSDLR